MFIRLITIILISTQAFASEPKIGILVPLEHAAMQQITSGIKETLIGTNVIVQNAQADSNIQLSLIKQMNDQNIDIIMPIGSSACQMTIAHRPHKYTVCVAAIMDKETDYATGVNDEIPITASIAKLPKLRKIAVIYSASEKITPEIEELKKYAKEHGVLLHLSMIQTLIDLPSAVKMAPDYTEAFLILKDHLVVSGVNVIAAEAIKRMIPLIASDEGSVMNGATMAIGVKEKDIGIKAGEMANAILRGASPKDVPYQTIDALTIFVNKQNMLKQNLFSIDDLKKIGLPVVEL